jgi:hypothetical protein
MFIVDAVSSLTGIQIPFDALGIDVLLAGTQKALALPPGLTVFTCSPAARAKAAAGKRPARKIDPPSWTRVLKRAGIFAPLIFVALGLFNHETLPARIALTAAYTAFFIPFMYLMDRAMYRSYLRRTGNPPARRSWRRP